MAKRLFDVAIRDNGSPGFTLDGKMLHNDEVAPLVRDGCRQYKSGSEGVIVYLTNEEARSLNLLKGQS